MYANVTSSACEVTYVATTTNKISYVDSGSNGNGIWVSWMASGGFSVVVPRTWTSGKGFTNLALAFDAFAITQLINKFTDSQTGTSGTVGGGVGASKGSRGTDSQIASTSCPITAIMSFMNPDKQTLMLSAINKNNASGNWPTSQRDITVGAPYVIGDKISVLLNTVPSGGASAPVEAKWTAFAYQWTQDFEYA
ncbi:hypothetical protein B0H13DRAFT_2294773 [Mycena leptocephala]|nr:hypothetical protein B0H13DRAFT_2294773 [Mycena leptocephala]